MMRRSQGNHIPAWMNILGLDDPPNPLTPMLSVRYGAWLWRSPCIMNQTALLEARLIVEDSWCMCAHNKRRNVESLGPS